MSNIAKLSYLYKEGEFEDTLKRKTTAKRLYTNGVGTYDSDIVDAIHFIERKYDKGGGGGGARRIYEMIDKVSVLLDGHPYHKSDDTKYSTREIDVFGFSRGAAMARDFVNTFYEEKVNIDSGSYGYVRFNFIGLFDTVGSFGKPGNPLDMKPKREYLGKVDEDYLPNGMQLGDEEFGIRDAKGNIKTIIGHANSPEDLAAKVSSAKANGWKDIQMVSVGFKIYTAYDIYGSKPVKEFFEPYNFDLKQGVNASSKHIYHLTAHDEVRKNFPLTDTFRAGKSNSLIGVHSDVGGGYEPNETEVFVYPTEYHSQDKALRRAETLAHEMNAKSFLGGWSASVEPIHYANSGASLVYYGAGVTLYAPKLLKKTSNVLACIGLNLMYEEAKAYNVPFEPPKDKVPSYLEGYYEHAKKQQGYTYVQTQDGAKIKHGFSHHSARDPAHKYDHKIATVGVWDGVVHDTPGSGNDALYHDKDGHRVDGRKHPELADHVAREIYANNPDEAVVPGENKTEDKQ
jgi:hypothetical protein